TLITIPSPSTILSAASPFSYTHAPRTGIYTLSLHDALPILQEDTMRFATTVEGLGGNLIEAMLTLIAFLPVLVKLSSNERQHGRSEEHTSELQSRGHLVCRLLLEKKKYKCRRSCQLDHSRSL